MGDSHLKLVEDGAKELPGAVLLNQPEQETEPDAVHITGQQLGELAYQHLTFVDLAGLCFTKANQNFDSSESGAAKREYALAKTALEDAIMRFNRARSLDLGCFHVSDTESPEFLAYLDAAKLNVEAEPETTTEGGE